MSLNEPCMLRHLAYFAELKRIGDDAEPEFQAVAAGLYALRLFDTWVQDDCGTHPPDARQLCGARDAIALAPPSATMRVLGHVVETVASAPGLEGSMVLPALLAYARALHFEARWALAQDVYDTVLSVASCVSDEELLLQAMHLRGYTLRMQGRLDEAAVAYRQLRVAAEFTGATAYVLEGRLSEAKLAIDRGNLPKAEQMLDALLSEPDTIIRPALHSKALHDRSVVALHRGQHERAVVTGYQALELCKDPASRDRILSDIATSLVSLGQWDGARDGFLIVAATAQEQYVRWTATINLMELAFLQEQELVFNQYQRELANAALPPGLAALYCQILGQGLRVFGRPAEGREALEQGRAIARKHELSEILFKIEELLEARDQVPYSATLLETAAVDEAMLVPVSEVVTGLSQMLQSLASPS
jgi:tetratricopeptide (TPR) repeat protein